MMRYDTSYSIVEQCTKMTATLSDVVGKGCTSISLSTQRELTPDEEALVLAVIGDTLKIENRRSVEYYKERLRAAGYQVIKEEDDDDGSV